MRQTRARAVKQAPFVVPKSVQHELEPLPLAVLPPAGPVYGQTDVLAQARNRLARDRFMTLEGMTGMGKTTLLRHLISEESRSVIVVTARYGLSDKVETWLMQVASGLSHYRESRLWELQEYEWQQARELPLVIKLGYLLEAVRSHDVTLWLDDAHLIFDEPKAVATFTELYQTLRYNPAYRCSVIISGLTIPPMLNDFMRLTVGGLDQQAAERLLEAHGFDRLPPHLTPSEALERLRLRLLRELPTYVGGNPKLLEYCAQWWTTLRRAPRLTMKLRNLSHHGVFVPYLTARFWEALTPDEQICVTHLAGKRTQRWTRPQLQKVLIVLAREALVATAPFTLFTQLVNTYLLLYSDQNATFTMVPILRDFWQSLRLFTTFSNTP